MELDRKAVGKRVRAARKKAGLTQEHLAELLGISSTHMSNIENNHANFGVESIVKIANTLKVSLDDLFCDSLVVTRMKYDEELTELLSDCTDYEKRVICSMVAAMKESLRSNQ